MLGHGMEVVPTAGLRIDHCVALMPKKFVACLLLLRLRFSCVIGHWNFAFRQISDLATWILI